MKRKVLVLAVLSLVMCLLLTGCGKKEEEKKENTNKENQSAITNNENTPEPKKTAEPNNNENNENNENNNSNENNQNNNGQTENNEQKVKLSTDDKRFVIDTPQGKIVINHEGEKITGYYLYVNYIDEASAKAALEVAKQQYGSELNIKKIYTEDNYVVFEYVEEEYEGISYSDLKSLVDLYS